MRRNKLTEILKTQQLVHYDKYAEVDRLLDKKRNCEMTEKERQFWLAVLEKRWAKLLARKIRKSSGTGHLIYYEQYQNSITVKEGLVQLSDMFRMVIKIHEEPERNRMKSMMMKHGLMIWIRKLFLLNRRCKIGWRMAKRPRIKMQLKIKFKT